MFWIRNVLDPKPQAEASPRDERESYSCGMHSVDLAIVRYDAMSIEWSR